MVRKRRRHTAACKFRVAVEAFEGSKTISRLSSEHETHANLIGAWKRQLQEDGPRVFPTNGERKQRQQEAQEAELHELIGRFKMELEWLKKKLPASVNESRHKVDVADPTLSVRRQRDLLWSNRSSFYDQTALESALNLQPVRLFPERSVCRH